MSVLTPSIEVNNPKSIARERPSIAWNSWSEVDGFFQERSPQGSSPYFIVIGDMVFEYTPSSKTAAAQVLVTDRQRGTHTVYVSGNTGAIALAPALWTLSHNMELAWIEEDREIALKRQERGEGEQEYGQDSLGLESTPQVQTIHIEPQPAEESVSSASLDHACVDSAALLVVAMFASHDILRIRQAEFEDDLHSKNIHVVCAKAQVAVTEQQHQEIKAQLIDRPDRNFSEAVKSAGVPLSKAQSKAVDEHYIEQGTYQEVFRRNMRHAVQAKDVDRISSLFYEGGKLTTTSEEKHMLESLLADNLITRPETLGCLALLGERDKLDLVLNALTKVQKDLHIKRSQVISKEEVVKRIEKSGLDLDGRQLGQIATLVSQGEMGIDRLQATLDRFAAAARENQSTTDITQKLVAETDKLIRIRDYEKKHGLGRAA